MSAGAFVRAKYQSNELDVHPIRVQPETIAATFNGTANAQPTGTVDLDIAVSTTRSRRAYGIHARFATIVFSGTPPAGYKAGTQLRIPILTQSLWSSIARNQEVVYLEANAIVISKTQELIR